MGPQQWPNRPCTDPCVRSSCQQQAPFRFYSACFSEAGSERPELLSVRCERMLVIFHITLYNDNLDMGLRGDAPFACTSRVRTLAKTLLNLKMAPTFGTRHVIHLSRDHGVLRHRGHHSFCRGSLSFRSRRVVNLLHAQSSGSGNTLIASALQATFIPCYVHSLSHHPSTMPAPWVRSGTDFCNCARQQAGSTSCQIILWTMCKHSQQAAPWHAAVMPSAANKHRNWATHRLLLHQHNPQRTCSVLPISTLTGGAAAAPEARAAA